MSLPLGMASPTSLSREKSVCPHCADAGHVTGTFHTDKENPSEEGLKAVDRYRKSMNNNVSIDYIYLAETASRGEARSDFSAKSDPIHFRNEWPLYSPPGGGQAVGAESRNRRTNT